MSVDNKFLDKMLYFLNEVRKATVRTNYVNSVWEKQDYPEYNSIFTSLCTEFCEYIIKKSEFVNDTQVFGKVLQLYGGELTIDQLCGMIPDNEEQNRYWYMQFQPEVDRFKIQDNYVYYTLCQHGSANMWVNLRVLKEDFDRFLIWAFSYLDGDCLEENTALKIKDQLKDKLNEEIDNIVKEKILESCKKE